MSQIPRMLLAVGALITFVGFGVVVGGVASLQWKAKDLNIEGAHIADPVGTAPLVAAYTATFTEGRYIAYPLAAGYQFGYAWWLIWGEFAIFALTVLLLLVPKYVQSARLVVIAWLASFQMLAWDHINTVLFLHRNEVANGAFGSKRIDATLAGLFLVAIGNGITITALGLYNSPTPAPHAAPTKGDIAAGAQV